MAPFAEASAELAIWIGRPIDARGAITEAFQRLPSDKPGYVSRIGPLYGLALRAEADLATLARARHKDEELGESSVIARRYLGTLRSLHATVAGSLPNFLTQADAYLAVCEAESARLDGTSDPELWAAAADAFGRIPMAYPRAYSLFRQGESAAKAGARATAIGPLREAHGIAQALGAAPLAKEVERLAGHGRLNLGGQPATPPSSPDLVVSLGLTTRELEVLQLVALGRTNRQIAEELFITEKTAGHHVSNILAKLGARGRTEAAAVAQRLGLAARSIDHGGRG